MKSINLTSSQKSKLLEMCKKLFPNDKVDHINDNLIKFLINYYEIKDRNNDKITFGSWEKIVKIHWFEFCMTHLIVQLSKEFTKQGLSKADYTNNQYPNWFSEKLAYHLNPFRDEEFEEDVKFINPVDYLYKEFKKL